MAAPLKQFCKHGHDTFVTGRYKGSICVTCSKQHSTSASSRIQHANYRRKNSVRINRTIRNWKWRLDGILNADGSIFSAVDFDRNYQIQSGECKICGIHQSELSRALAVDHDHKTKVFRGLLCSRCNIMLGQSLDNKDILANGIEYLKNNNAK